MIALAVLLVGGPAVIAPLFSDARDLEGRQIREVEFLGLRNVSADELYPLLTSRIGEPLEVRSFNEDIKALFDTGYFSRVEMRLRSASEDRVDIIFRVEEHPRVESIEFLGADEMPATDLKSELAFRTGDVYSPARVREGVESVRERYFDEGFFLAEVWVQTSPVDENNEVSVTYIVDEGENIPISKINVIGAKELDPEDITDILEQNEESFLDEGSFRESKYEEDKFKILAFAKTNGYLDAEIDPRLTGYEVRWRNPAQPEAGRVVVITYKLEEGAKKFFAGYSAEHDPDSINLEVNPPERQISGPEDLTPIYTPELILDNLEFNETDLGDVFDEGRYFRDRGFMQDLYAREGYVFAQIRPEFVNFQLNDATLSEFERCAELPEGGADERCRRHAGYLNLPRLRAFLEENPEQENIEMRHVHFVISENNLAYIENIIIKGMVKTQEHVIRRELLIKEGQLYNSGLVDRSREKLVNLGYFKEVNVLRRPGSRDDQMNLIFDVEEQPTGTISVGGGYGTVSGFSIFTEVGERNLNGTGQKLQGRLEFGPLRRSVSINWSDPWFYERCEDTTGSFWKNKLRDFENASGYDQIVALAETFRNDYSELGKVIVSYVDETGGEETLKNLNWVKSRIRLLLYDYVEAEEDCYRSFPRPWSLRLGAFWSNSTFNNVSPLRVSNDLNDLFEDAAFDRTRVGLTIGTQHAIFINWAHYHIYTPSWAIASRPTALANDAVLQEVELGWQFKSSLRNGLIYSTVDNVFNPTNGTEYNFEIETVGQLLGGQDHFNRYTVSATSYIWWFDYTLFGLFRSNTLRRWRVVQEFRAAGIFTHEAAPQGNQDKEKNPFIEPEDRMYLGGPALLRGYDQLDPLYPSVWQDGGNHMLYGGTELRFPVEPSLLWIVVFFDYGALFDNIGEYNEDLREAAEAYEEQQAISRLNSDPIVGQLLDRADPFTFFTRPYHFDSRFDWNNPKRAVLSQRNVALDRTLYSWGFGLRIQIPVLPLRLYVAQKLYYAGNSTFKPIPGDDEFQFVFGIGDQRF